MAEPVQDQNQPAPFGPVAINRVALTAEDIDDFRLNFGQQAPAALAKDLLSTFQQDFADRLEEDPNFLDYEGLKSGQAGILNFIPEYADLPPERRALNDDAIIALFSNAEPASLSRAFFGELARTAPSTYAGVKAGARVAAPLVKKALTSGGSPAAVGAKTVAALGTGLAAGAGAGYLAYEAADAIEEQILGPDPVVVPGERALYEAFRTAGGAAGGAFMPYLYNPANNWRIASTIEKIYDNPATELQGARGLPLRAARAVETFIGRDAVAARQSKRNLAWQELTAGAGAAVGAYGVEELVPGSTGVRLAGELVGSSTTPVLLLQAIPAAVRKVTDGTVNLVQTAARGMPASEEEARKNNFINYLSSVYEKFQEPEDYDRLTEQLTSEETRRMFEEAFPGVPFTAAQRSDDPVVQAMEGAVAAANEGLSGQRFKNNQKAFNFAMSFIDGLMSTGTETAAREAAMLRTQAYRDILSARMRRGMDRLTEARANVLGVDSAAENPETRAQLGNQVSAFLQRQMELARATERTLWGRAQAANVPVVFDTEQVPAYIQVFNDIAYLNPRVQREFLGATNDVSGTILDHKRMLGLDADVPETQAFLNTFDGAEEGDQLFFEQVMGSIGKQRGVDFENASPESVALLETYIRSMSDLDPVDLPDGFNIDLFESKLGELRAKAAAAEAAEEIPPITAGQLQELRSRALQAARRFGSGPDADRDYALKMGELAEAIRETMEGALEPGVNQAFDEARDFSRAKHDVFTRTLLGKEFETAATGARKIPAEIWVDQLAKSNPSMTLYNYRMLENVAKFAQENGFPGASGVLTSVTDLTDSMLRRAVEEKVMIPRFDAQTGVETLEVNPTQLARFRRQNRELLQLFPELDADLSEATSAQRAFEVMRARQKKNEARLKDQKYLSNLLKGSSPMVVIEDAFDSDTPFRDLQKAFRLMRVKGADRERVAEAFRTAIVQNALAKAGGRGRDTFKPSEFYRQLFAEMPKDPNRSLMDVALSYEIFTPEQAQRLKFMVEQLSRLEKATSAQPLKGTNVSAEEFGPLADLYATILGSAASSQAYKAVGGTGPGVLAVAGRGARAFRNMLLQVPQTAMMDIRDELFMNPELFAKFIRRPGQDEAQKANRYSAIMEDLQDLGFGEALGDRIERTARRGAPFFMREAAEDEDRGTGRVMTPPAPPAPRPTAPAQAAPAPAPVPAAPPVTAAPQPATRQQYAALFPFESTSQMIRASGPASGGIGSLMG